MFRCKLLMQTFILTFTFCSRISYYAYDFQHIIHCVFPYFSFHFNHQYDNRPFRTYRLMYLFNVFVQETNSILFRVEKGTTTAVGDVIIPRYTPYLWRLINSAIAASERILMQF